MTLLNKVYFFVILPLWLGSASLNIYAFFKKRTVRSPMFRRWNLTHSVTQVTTILFGLLVGFLGAEVYRNW
ncbi:hypothetical protein ST201phi2-1p469 [Pseudomonas phage 201phi2-1]|uniref:Uncharacterized protein n=1 Tax=Pseudomonas phage 201phi2-1 TaxID=198110 RepID=B3FJK4_BP201|nr:hypothetical protein ST201phi2-1p469 [Pseudomonas phage 201phi2-1]ABY63169.1 hypothetical protein 201phi2-1p469 [Pseudomonas phage 201phi2-1]